MPQRPWLGGDVMTETVTVEFRDRFRDARNRYDIEGIVPLTPAPDSQVRAGGARLPSGTSLALETRVLRHSHG
jgi:hypothetical protein